MITRAATDGKRIVTGRLRFSDLTHFPYGKGHDPSRYIEIMAGADHRGEPFFASSRVRRRAGERADAAAAGEAERGFGGLRLRLGKRLLAAFYGDSRLGERGHDSPPAQAPRRHAPRLGQGVGAIVDIAGPLEPLAQGVERRLAGPGPAALAQLAAQVLAELVAGGGEPRDIGQRKLRQGCFVKLGKRPALSSSLRHALFVPRFPTITKGRTRASVALVRIGLLGD